MALASFLPQHIGTANDSTASISPSPGSINPWRTALSFIRPTNERCHPTPYLPLFHVYPSNRTLRTCHNDLSTTLKGDGKYAIRFLILVDRRRPCTRMSGILARQSINVYAPPLSSCHSPIHLSLPFRVRGPRYLGLDPPLSLPARIHKRLLHFARDLLTFRMTLRCYAFDSHTSMYCH